MNTISGKVALATKQDSLEVTLNAIQTKVATAVKQDSAEVTLNIIAGKDFATSVKQDSAEVTLNIIAAKDFATSAKQTTQTGHLADIRESDSTLVANGIGIISSTNSYSVPSFSTVGTVKDSVVFGFTTKSVFFMNDGIATDTLFVSSSASFPSTNTIRRNGGEGFTKYWGVTKLYFKVGTTPLASKKLRIEAN